MAGNNRQTQVSMVSAQGIFQSIVGLKCCTQRESEVKAMAKLMKKWQKLRHGEVLVKVLLSQVNELRKDQVAGTSQAADQDAASEEASKSHVRRAGSAIAAYQCEMRRLSEGNSALRGVKNKAE